MSQYSLSNEQLLYIYYHMQQVRTTYERMIRSGVIHQAMMNTQIVAVMQIPKDIMDDIKKSEHFRHAISITDKLKPIVEMIEEAEPDLAEAVKKAFKKDNHEDFPEDL